MRLTYIGHQTWHVEHMGTKILIDPLLRTSFGLTKRYELDIYPPRKVDHGVFEDLDAIFLSHEHTDHFDIESLSVLPRSAKLFVGCTVVLPVRECLRRLGFSLVEVSCGDTIKVGNVLMRFYAADPLTAFWESRVMQVLLRSSNSDGGAFIAVDALVSPNYKKDVESGCVACPELIVVSNNARISPQGSFQSLENWGATNRGRKKSGPTGIVVMCSVLHRYLSEFPILPKNIAICGGGFAKKSAGLSTFPYSDHDEMAALVNNLSMDVNVVGLRPGQVFRLGKPLSSPLSVDWVTVDHSTHEQMKADLESFISKPKCIDLASSVLPDYESTEAFEAALSIARSELCVIEKPLALSTTGRKALGLETHGGEALGPRRIVISLRCERLGRRINYALDMISGAFVVDENTDCEDLTRRFPFGIDMPLVDFVGMVKGELQIWDIVGESIASWFEGSIFDGLIPFFYCYYGENGSPELLALIIERKLKELGVP